jgi:hypothetical protein
MESINALKIAKVNEYIDNIFYFGKNYKYAEIANAVGCSETFVQNQFCARLPILRSMEAEKKVKYIEVPQVEYHAQEMHGRIELINGKVCHVYPSRMNEQ